MSRPTGKEAGSLTAYAVELLAKRATPRGETKPLAIAPPPPAPPGSAAPPAEAPTLDNVRSSEDRDSQMTFFSVRPGVWEDHLAANRDLAERLHQAMSKAGMGRRDPLTPVVNLLTELLQQHTQLAADQISAMRQVGAEDAAELRRVLEAATRTMAEAVATARQVATAAGEAVKEAAGGGVYAVRSAAMQALDEQQHSVRYFEGRLHDMLRDALDASARQARRLEWQGIAITAAVGAVLLLAVGAGAFWQGAAWKESLMQPALQAARTDVQQTEPGLRAAFAAGPEAAAGWIDLMNWNRDLPLQIQGCIQRSGFIGDAWTQRMACTLPIWVEPPPSPEVAAARSALRDAQSAASPTRADRPRNRAETPWPGPMHFGD